MLTPRMGLSDSLSLLYLDSYCFLFLVLYMHFNVFWANKDFLHARSRAVSSWPRYGIKRSPNIQEINRLAPHPAEWLPTLVADVDVCVWLSRHVAVM